MTPATTMIYVVRRIGNTDVDIRVLSVLATSHDVLEAISGMIASKGWRLRGESHAGGPVGGFFIPAIPVDRSGGVDGGEVPE